MGVGVGMVGTELGVGWGLIPGPTAWTWRLLWSGGYRSVQEPAPVLELRALGLCTPNRSPSTANRASQTPVHTAGVNCMLPCHSLGQTGPGWEQGLGLGTLPSVSL